MCGIAGFLVAEQDLDAAAASVRRMCDRMEHRGPDDHGLLVADPMVLGHRRLSIIDLRSEAAQPMTNEDDSLALVVNGEIYNFAELRAELERKGHRFKSNSDSEVVLHLYEEEGPDCLPRLRGMYALALWDKGRQRLLLARDRFGKKPLYYHHGPHGLVFASELQALVACGHVTREVDLDAVDAYLALQYVPAPRTAYLGIRKLLPGHSLGCQPGQAPSLRRYYALRFDRRTDLDFEEAKLELQRLVQEAVRIRMVSDVPLGAFLSGGVDSSLVVACMARASSRPVQTFSIGFPSQDHSELAYAGRVARLFGTEHHEMVVAPDMVSIIPKLVHHYGEPYGDTSAVPTWYLSQFTRQHVTVALSGDAGDEGFAGYNRYQYARIARALTGLPGPVPALLTGLLSRLPLPALQPIRDFGRRLMQDEASRYLGFIAHFPHDDRLGLYSTQMRDRFARDPIGLDFAERLRASSARDPVSRLQDLDFQTYLPDDILVKVDIASMAHALEVRCPLLDHEVVEFAASLPSKMKLRGLTGKAILKAAAADWLPRNILDRRKQGFALPIDRWMREDLAGMSRDLLLDPTARARGLFSPAAVEQLLTRHQEGESRGLQIWNLLMLEHWFRAFIDRSPE
jgi:asparagine synthase (glutamine-hydrolysing)